MYELIILNMDKEKVTLDVTEAQLKSCIQAVEDGRTFHIEDQKQGFFFPLNNIRVLTYHLKPQPQEEVCQESQSQSQ